MYLYRILSKLRPYVDVIMSPRVLLHPSIVKIQYERFAIFCPTLYLYGLNR